MHKPVYDHGKNAGYHSTVQKAYRTDIPPEHYCVHLNRYNNISVKQNSESRAKNNPRNSQKNVFSQYVLRNLFVVEAQNLQSCQFSLSLCNINIVQIIQNYKGKHSRRNDQHYNNNSQCAEHSFHLGRQA